MIPFWSRDSVKIPAPTKLANYVGDDKRNIRQSKTPPPRSTDAEDAMGQAVTELEKLNKKADVIIGIMMTPEKTYVRIMGIIGNAVSIIGILAIVEIIRNWIAGG